MTKKELVAALCEFSDDTEIMAEADGCVWSEIYSVYGDCGAAIINFDG